jgi:microcystin-dependent protein
VILSGHSLIPAYWITCDGQLLPTDVHTELYELIGTAFGGNGQSTFAIPDLRGRTPIGTSERRMMGRMEGSETVTLTVSQIPSHTHTMIAANRVSTSSSPCTDCVPAHTQYPVYTWLPTVDSFFHLGSGEII